MVMLIMTVLVAWFFLSAFRNPKLVPGRLQSVGEMAVDFVRVQIIDEIIGREGRRFLPYLTTLFFFILALNLAGVIPLLNLAPTGNVAVPLVLAVITWVVFNTVGIKKHGLGGYLKANLFPPGVPKPIYLLLTPIEAFSTFIMRPLTLTIRLMANMLAGFFLVGVCYYGATYLLFDAEGAIRIAGGLAYVAGIGFTLFEVFIAALQAYIFTLLSAIYIGSAVAEEH